MAAAVTDRTRCVVICTPNNPTGTSVRSTELAHFLTSVPDDVTVVIDEAYVEFDQSEDRVDGIDLVRRHPNVAVARTFSKAYGLAGLRVGYVIAPTELTSAMRKVSVPFGVTDLAASAAIASIHAEAELIERVHQLSRERDRVAGQLRSTGWFIPKANGNFIWLPLGNRTSEALAVFESYGLIVRPFLDEGVRVTIAETDSNERVLAAASQLVQLGLAGDVDAISNPTGGSTLLSKDSCVPPSTRES